jgi:hypothetical protein
VHYITLELELITDLDLDRTQLQRKIRLLTLASIGFKYVGKDLPYAEIASALQIDVSEVEKWVIDGDYLLLISTRSLSDFDVTLQSFALGFFTESYLRPTRPCMSFVRLFVRLSVSIGKRWRKGLNYGRGGWLVC